MDFTDERGVRHCAYKLAELQGVKYNTLVYRRLRGWTDLEIIAGKRSKVRISGNRCNTRRGKLLPFKEEIIARRLAGEGLTEIGIRFGTDSGNISRFLKRLGFDEKKVNNCFNRKREDDVRRLRSQGLSVMDIAKELEVSHNTIWHYIKRLGLPSLPKLKKRHFTKAEKESRRIWKNERLAGWRERHKDSIANKRKERRGCDVVFAMKERVRAVTRNAFVRKRWSKGKQTHILLGCSWPELKTWIESLFVDGMNWGNMGEWHIDHKIPLASATTVDELKQLCKFTNLQPLWAKDNLSKGSRSEHCHNAKTHSKFTEDEE